MKRLIIVHGYTGDPSSNWFPWLKSEAQKLGLAVEVPIMPNTNAPQLDEWLPHLQQVVGTPDEDTYLIGHSLGCATILRYLESLKQGQHIGGAVLVAGFAEHIHLTELNSFTAESWDDEAIKRATNDLILINSDNDEHVPLEMGERMSDRFGAELVVVHKAGHITERSGYKEAPFIVEQLKKII